MSRLRVAEINLAMGKRVERTLSFIPHVKDILSLQPLLLT